MASNLQLIKEKIKDQLWDEIMNYKRAIFSSITLLGTLSVFSAFAAENEAPTIQVEADKIIDATTSVLNLDKNFSADRKSVV